MPELIIRSKGIDYLCLYDQGDHKLISQFTWSLHSKGYAVTTIKGKPVLMHRLILGLVDRPEIEVDHRFHNRLDNRRSKLRVCTHSQNRRNSRKLKESAQSQYKGVYRDNNKYHAQIMIDNQVINLGRYRSQITAGRIYDQAALKTFKDFAYLNFPGLDSFPKTINNFNLMIQGQKYYQLIPEKVFQNLNSIEDLLRPGIKGYSTDNLKEVISIIACHVRKDDNEDPPLKMKYFRQLVPYAERYLIGLIDLGIIKRSPYYIPGEVSYRYNFTPEYQSKYISLPLINAKMILRIRTAYSELGKESVKLIWGYSNQVKYLKQLTLADGWQDLIESYKSNEDQYNSVLASALRIVNGDFFYSIDETEGRFHSNITNMKKELRLYLRINGKPLTNLDIKNSQPYLSTIILTYPSKVAWLTKNPAFSMLLQTLKVSLNKDVKKYISLVASGNFYEYLMQQYSIEGLELSRKETKLQVLRILFACNRMPKDETNRKARQIFIDRFPTVHRIFSKVRGRDQGTKFENSNRFAILLATIESYLLLNVIVKRINKELPHVIVMTIHDSIMTGILTDDVEAVRKIMNDELTSFVGFSPKIEIDCVQEKIIEEKNKNKTLIQYDVTNTISLN